MKRNKKNLLPKQLDLHLERFIGVLEAYNRKLPHPRSRKTYPFLRNFFKHFIVDQNKRAQEISTPKYEKIKKIANEQFPIKTLWNLCIDGRVLSILAHGASAGVGNSVRVPGGMLREFVRGKDGELKLEENSDFAMLLKKALVDSKTDVLAEVFDSHIGCSARALEEQLKGRMPQDFGLLADVSHKMQMAQAAIAFTKENFGVEKKLLVILTSFNPHSGFMYMGLETKEALLYVYKRGNAYTNEILENLVTLGRIISTESLAEEERIKELFESHKFTLDWKSRYVKSALLFWSAIANMKKVALPIIEKKLERIYPHLVKNDRLAKIELEERAMLLLTNAFSAYLHNLSTKSHVEWPSEGGNHHLYPYGLHREEGVKVGEGGYPPYSISTFSVFSFEEKNLPSNIQMAVSLVRANRKEQRVTDESRTFTDALEFMQASVPIVVLEIVRDSLSQREWDFLLSLDWKDMSDDWDIMSDDAFYSFLHSKGILHFGLAVAINNLRHKLSVMYEMHSPISSRLIEQYAVALPIVSSQNRKVRLIIPFAKLGFA